MVYKGNKEDYANDLDNLKRRLSQFSTKDARSITTKVIPYGISIGTGLPLFNTHDMQKDYNSMTEKTRKILPNQFFHGNGRAHITLSVIKRNKPLREGNHYIPKGAKKDFYKEYLEIFRGIKFKPFSLRLEGIYPAGIIVWSPEENPDEIFNIRKQISKGLEDKRKSIGLEFDVDKKGDPNVESIIHTTFMKPYCLPELAKKFDAFTDFLGELNSQIQDGKIFQTPLEINALNFTESRISANVTLEDYYTEIVLEKRVV